MAYEIEIIEGHDPSSYFWFHPVKVKDNGKDLIYDEDIFLYDEEFSIEEGDIECFLWHFFEKYYDKELFCNKRYYDRVEGGANPNGFEWYLTDNFYKYETIKSMLAEINEVADLLENDFDNELLSPIKNHFSIFYMTEHDNPDHISGNSTNEALRRHKECVISFYRRFVDRLSRMMENNPQVDMISICGP